MKWTWLLNDAHGNTATLIGDDGAVIEQKAFDPYGAELQGGSKRTEATDAPKATLGFQGARTDEATGRVMLGPRQYDPSSGRFTSPDFFVAGALDLQLGTDALTGNRYLFAGAMPTTFYEDGHGFGSFLKKTVKKVAPVLEYVPVVSTAIDITNAATGKNWYEGGRPMSGAERMMAIGTAGLGLIPGGTAGKAGAKAATKGLDKANSARKLKNAGRYDWPNARKRINGGYAEVRANPAFPRGREYRELSHWLIPKRANWAPDWLKNSRWNIKKMWGSDHALADPLRYRFMPRTWKDAHKLPNAAVRFWRRTPGWAQFSFGAGILAVGFASFKYSQRE